MTERFGQSIRRARRRNEAGREIPAGLVMIAVDADAPPKSGKSQDSSVISISCVWPSVCASFASSVGKSLPKRTAQQDVDELHPPANTENRLSRRQKRAQQGDLVSVPRLSRNGDTLKRHMIGIVLRAEIAPPVSSSASAAAACASAGAQDASSGRRLRRRAPGSSKTDMRIRHRLPAGIIPCGYQNGGT